MNKGKNIQAASQQGSSAELLVEPGTAVQPDVDIVEEPQGLTLYLDVPGVAPGATKVEVDENGILSMRAKNTFREPEGELVRQAQVRDYYRAFQLGQEFDRAKIKASLKDGVLTLTIPRKEDAIPKRIEIET
jgi:HSP20 family molecular chaperone IbpA